VVVLAALAGSAVVSVVVLAVVVVAVVVAGVVVVLVVVGVKVFSIGGQVSVESISPFFFNFELVADLMVFDIFVLWWYNILSDPFLQF